MRTRFRHNRPCAASSALRGSWSSRLPRLDSIGAAISRTGTTSNLPGFPRSEVPPVADEAYIQAISRFIIGFGTEQDDIWRDYNLDFAGKIAYDSDGNPVAFAPVGNSGYSLGSLQWDFGQSPLLAGPFIEAFEGWFANNPKATPLKSDPEFATRAVALQGNVLTPKPYLGLKQKDVKALSEFVRSDVGSNWVNTNIDQNLIGSDAQAHIKWKTEEMTQVAVARRIEATAAFK